MKQTMLKQSNIKTNYKINYQMVIECKDWVVPERLVLRDGSPVSSFGQLQIGL